MRKIVIGLGLMLAGSVAWAQTRDENVAKCLGNHLDAKINGCTALIQSSQEATESLAGC